MNLEKVEQQNFFQEEPEVIKEDPGVKGWLNLSSHRKKKNIPSWSAGSVDPLHTLRIDTHTLDVFSAIVRACEGQLSPKDDRVLVSSSEGGHEEKEKEEKNKRGEKTNKERTKRKGDKNYETQSPICRM